MSAEIKEERASAVHSFTGLRASEKKWTALGLHLTTPQAGVKVSLF